jgi:hypothetical protein
MVAQCEGELKSDGWYRKTVADGDRGWRGQDTRDEPRGTAPWRADGGAKTREMHRA